MKSLLVFNTREAVVHKLAAYFKKRSRFKKVLVDYRDGTVEGIKATLFSERKKFFISVRTLNAAITNIDVSIQSFSKPKRAAAEKEEDELLNKFFFLL